MKAGGAGEGGLDGVGDAVLLVSTGDPPAESAGAGEELGGRVAHEDGGAGDVEHGEVVPVVADGHDVGGGVAACGGERGEGGAFAGAGGEDVDDGEVAGWVLGAVEGDLGGGCGG